MAVAALINRIRFVLIFELLQSSIGAFIFGDEAWSFILIASTSTGTRVSVLLVV